MPGVNIDPVTRMLYVDCPKHYKEMEIKRSFTCPIKKCASNVSARFATQSALAKHLSKEHQLYICHLCLDNRPLFISEHKLMNDAQLKKHMKEKTGSLTGAGGDKTGGHPLCQFCKSHFYDSLALYNHMVDEHHTCHLCPVQYQHRFYDGMYDITKHWRDNHIICDICHPKHEKLNERDDQISIFGNDRDYCEHMLGVHGVKKKSSGISLGFQIGTGSNSNECTYVDLYMSQADPYQRGDANGSNSNSNRYRNIGHSNTIPSNSTLTNIPTNMRIAGRVTGAGNFKRDNQDDIIQAAIDESQPKSSWNKGNLSLKQGNNIKDFPEMIPSISKDIKVTKFDHSSIEPHPLSLVHIKLKELEISNRIQLEEKENLKLEEEKKRKRNDALANALGIKQTIKYSGDDNDTVLLCSICDNNYSILDINTATIYINEIRRPLYPSPLANWSSRNKIELQKIEKKINVFLEQKSNNSLQFKPMDSISRNMIHTLSKFYHLNSYEYNDGIKRKYVSFVKSVHSSSPKTRLSSSMSLGLSQTPSLETISENPLPIIYFIAKNTNELIASTIATTRDNSTSSIDIPGVYSLIMKLQNMLETSGIKSKDISKIISIKQCGMSGIGFEFISLLEASKFYNLLINSSSTFVIISSQYYVEPSFDYNLYIQDLKIEINENEDINKKEEIMHVIPTSDGSFTSRSTASFNSGVTTERRPLVILPRTLPMPEILITDSWEDVDIDNIGKSIPIIAQSVKKEKEMNYNDAFKETALIKPTSVVVKPKKLKKNKEDLTIPINSGSFATFNDNNFLLNSLDKDSDNDNNIKEINDNIQLSEPPEYTDVSDEPIDRDKSIYIDNRKLEVISNKKIDSNIWTCSRCTFDNDVFNDICAMCGGIK
jgi:hypothetical protein